MEVLFVSYENQKQVNAISKYLKTDINLKKFKYYSSFVKKWIRLLNYHNIHNYLFCQQCISDNDQIYEYEYPFFDTNLIFRFSIQYIRTFFFKSNRNPDFFPIITLNNNNGNLMYNGFTCEYTDYKIENSTVYSDYNDIFIAPFPSIPLRYIAIDGNHRLSSQVNSNRKNISARYCPIEICERSLISSFDIVMYTCLMDCYQIKINMNRYSDLHIKQSLRVFDDSSFVNNLEKRGI